MADEEPKNMSESMENDKTDQNGEEPLPLTDFITDQYERQMEDGKMPITEEISEERRNSFLQRALAESQRMREETAKSQAKMAKLNAEFGANMVTSWRNEHAAEVLLPHQAAAVAKASQENMDSYYAENPQT